MDSCEAPVEIFFVCVLPVFAAKAQRRSACIIKVYQEQAAISAERIAAAQSRRALREAALYAPAGTGLPGCEHAPEVR